MDTIIHFVSTLPEKSESSFFSNEIIVGIITAGAAVLSLIWAKYRENKDNLKKELREKKKPTYEKMIDIIKKIKQSPNDETLDLSKDLLDLAGDLMIWASDDVLKKWVFLIKTAVGKNMRDERYDGENLILQIDAVLRAIRKDLGHKNKNIKENEIISMFFNDMYVK